MKQALIILGKYPKKGSVKSRLAKEIGEDNAAKFYKDCAEYIFGQIDTLPEDIKIFFLCPHKKDMENIRKWTKDKYELIQPQSSDINHNILVSFITIFKLGYEKVITVATDLPDLTTQILSKALNELNSNEIVIGPDNDGGIYLFGQTKSHPELFNIPKNQQVFDSVYKRAKQYGLKIKILKKLIDVDTKKDLEDWKIKQKPSPKICDR